MRARLSAATAEAAGTSSSLQATAERRVSQPLPRATLPHRPPESRGCLCKRHQQESLRNGGPAAVGPTATLAFSQRERRRPQIPLCIYQMFCHLFNLLPTTRSQHLASGHRLSKIKEETVQKETDALEKNVPNQAGGIAGRLSLRSSPSAAAAALQRRLEPFFSRLFHVHSFELHV